MAYFSNGSEGAYLDDQCCECRLNCGNDELSYCPVHYIQMTYNYSQLNKGKGYKELRKAMNALVDKNGNCQMKISIDGAWPHEYFDGKENDTAKKMLDAL